MAVSPASERGVSARTEIKLFSEVSPEEIARRTGGSVEYHDGRASFINYDGLNAYIDVDSIHSGDGGSVERPVTVLNDYAWESNLRYILNSTAVILEEGKVTFVHSVQKRFDGQEREGDVLSWITISERDGISHNSVNTRQRGLDRNIIEAGYLARKRQTSSAAA